MLDIAIVGAGASGLAAGIAAGRRGARVILLERMPRAGKKILATGNGRCNLGNRRALEHPYHNKEFAAPALEQFGTEGCDSFFDSLGLAVQEDGEGRLYPRSNTAASVQGALRYGAARAGCEIKCDCPVNTIELVRDGFVINNDIAARRVIAAAGGCAAPAQGSDGSGFALLRSMGHSIVEPKPALVQIKVSSPLLPMLKGMRVQAKIQIEKHGEVLRRAEGEVLFAQDGLSGIAAMEVSREAGPGCAAVLDLLPDYTEEKLTALLSHWQGCCGDLTPADMLSGLLPGRVAEAVVKAIQSTPRPCGPPPSEEGGLAHMCKYFTFEVTG
ncbi:MAG: aminoacetone oxidase family FAD-binding enzyme, partial [Firmicutes bacterium]|nr:aminoacetone oxidase family FAD-binding enzyme [Bacillota bacterium]